MHFGIGRNPQSNLVKLSTKQLGQVIHKDNLTFLLL